MATIDIPILSQQSLSLSIVSGTTEIPDSQILLSTIVPYVFASATCRYTLADPTAQNISLHIQYATTVTGNQNELTGTVWADLFPGTIPPADTTTGPNIDLADNATRVWSIGTSTGAAGFLTMPQAARQPYVLIRAVIVNTGGITATGSFYQIILGLRN